jgi:hypothetical protein
MAKKSDQEFLTFLEQFTALVELMGFTETCEILHRVQAGERAKDLKPMIDCFTKHHQSLPPAVRAAHTRKVRSYKRRVLAARERGEI